MLEAVKWDVEGAALSRGLPYLASGVLDRQRTAVSLLFNICSVAAYQRTQSTKAVVCPACLLNLPECSCMSKALLLLFCTSSLPGIPGKWHVHSTTKLHPNCLLYNVPSYHVEFCKLWKDLIGQLEAHLDDLSTPQIMLRSPCFGWLGWPCFEL